MACFQPLAFAPSAYPLHSTARLACFARLAARLSSMLQIISQSVFSAAASFGNWPRFRVALRSSALSGAGVFKLSTEVVKLVHTIVDHFGP